MSPTSKITMTDLQALIRILVASCISNSKVNGEENLSIRLCDDFPKQLGAGG